MRRSILVILAGLLSLPHTVARAQSAGPDSAAVAATVRRFHEALRSGDSTAALALLADDAVILESGGTETRHEYRSHHLGGDIAFLRGVEEVPGAVRVAVEGDAAWASSVSGITGKYRGKAVAVASAELMVLSRTPAGWRIRAVHWSSGPRSAGK